MARGHDKRKRNYNPKSAKNLKPFPPGVSGNPNGRPLVPKSDREFQKEVDDLCVEALGVMRDAMRSVDAPWPARVSAANVIIERSKGKPNANIMVARKRDVTELGDDELIAIAGEAGAGAEGQGGGEAGAAAAAPGTDAVN